MDAKRNPDRVRREESEGEPDQPGKSFLVIALDRYHYPVKVLDVAEGLNYLHANHVVHGGLDGVDIFVRYIWALRITFG